LTSQKESKTLQSASAQIQISLFCYFMGASFGATVQASLALIYNSERENAGLNVTCASRVFLVESVVHHGFEVQGGCYVFQDDCAPADHSPISYRSY
jgi:hypothetical protein